MTRRVLLALSAMMFVVPSAFAETPSASDILAKVDKNLTSDFRQNKTKMTVVNPRRTREFEMVTYGRGESQAAIEYLAPRRDKGTKMLRIDAEMWMYMPTVEKTQKISGHMLRQGMMGSDVSYEDMTSSSVLQTSYDATVVATEDIDGRPAYKLEMKAKNPEVTYAMRYAWVDTESFIPVRQELFAKSGMLLKTWEMKDLKEFEDGRVFPMKMVIKDTVAEGTSTTLEFSDVVFNGDVPTDVFDRRWLERK